MVAIDMSVDTEQPPNNGANSVPEIAGKRDACSVLGFFLNKKKVDVEASQKKDGEDDCTYLIWEDVLVVQNALSPVHQRVDVFWSGEFGRLLVLHAVFPQVLIP